MKPKATAVGTRGAPAMATEPWLVRRGGMTEVNLDALETHSANSPAVVMLVNVVLVDSVKRGASDIHITGYRDRCAARFRIGGVLREAMLLPPQLWEPVATRILTMCGSQATGTTAGKTGRMRIRATIDNRSYECGFAVSYTPTSVGGRMILRRQVSKQHGSRPTRG
jgi:type IV pilus assembly protein PilB